MYLHLIRASHAENCSHRGEKNPARKCGRLRGDGVAHDSADFPTNGATVEVDFHDQTLLRKVTSRPQSAGRFKRPALPRLSRHVAEALPRHWYSDTRSASHRVTSDKVLEFVNHYRLK